MLTACRRDEIGGLRRNEINDDGTLILPPERVKNNHKHELPLTALALSIIGTVPERVGRDHLFGDRSGKGFTRWSVAKDALDKRVNGEMTGQWRLHDIRRAVATGMGNLGVSRTSLKSYWTISSAAMSMVRLWRDQGKRDEARDLLAPVYGWFTVGFDTLDLKEAKALLDELHG